MTPTFNFRTGGKEAEQATPKPTCNPCREHDHGRCPTVLAQNDIINSTFECACFHADPESHEADFGDKQEKRYEGFSPWDDHGMAGSYHRGYYATMRREAQRWGGVDY